MIKTKIGVQRFKSLSSSKVINQLEISDIPNKNFEYSWGIKKEMLKKILATEDGRYLVNVEKVDHSDIPYFLKFLDTLSLPTISYGSNQNHLPKYFFIIIRYQSERGSHISSGVSLENSYFAFYKAFGEYLERYTTYMIPKGEKKPKTYFKSDLTVYIDELPIPTAKQKLFKKKATYELLSKTEHLRLENSTTNRFGYIPFSHIYFGYRDKDLFLHQVTTNGSGAGFTIEDAKLSAIYELIERDNFLLYWLSGIKPEIVTGGSANLPAIEQIDKSTRKYRLKYHILNTSYDTNIFSCIFVLINPSKNQITIGGACGINVDQVIEKAYCEALAVMGSNKNNTTAEKNRDFYTKYESFTDSKLGRETRESFYSSAEGIKLFEKIFIGDEKISAQDLFNKYNRKFETKVKELENVVNIFKDLSKKNGNSHNLLFYEFKNNLLGKYDYKVVKAYVPAFFSLWLSEDMATPISKRLFRFVKDKNGKKGFKDEDINQFPHPFP